MAWAASILMSITIVSAVIVPPQALIVKNVPFILLLLTPLVLIAGSLSAFSVIKREFRLVDPILVAYMLYMLGRNRWGLPLLLYLGLVLFMFYLAAWLSGKGRQLNAVILVLVFMTALLSLHGVLESIFQRALILPVYFKPYDLFRSRSTLTHPIVFGAFLLQMIPYCCLVWKKNVGPTWFGKIAFTTLILSVTALITTMSISSLLTAIVLGAFGIAYLISRNRRLGLIMLAGSVILLSLAGVISWKMMPVKVTERLEISRSQRSYSWSGAMRGIKDNPVLGVGYRKGREEIYDQSFGENWQPKTKGEYLQPVDNLYLSMLLEVGVTGFGLWAAFIILLLKDAVDTFRRRKDMLVLAATVSFAALLVNAVSYEALSWWSNLSLFIFSAGIIRGAGMKKKQQFA